jgi:REP element-mobilizing transposase RayT
MFPLTRSLFHCLFATRDGEPLLTPEIRDRLGPHFDEIARSRNFKVLASGGGNDHLHLLLSLSPAMSLTKAVQILKGESALWINQTFATAPKFRWQEGYGAFSIGIAALKETCAYIRNEGKHRVGTYRDELMAYVQAHALPFDDRALE